MTDTVTYEVRPDGAATRLTLNRPDKMNALNRTLIEDLRDMIKYVEANDDVRVIVLTGPASQRSALDTILNPTVTPMAQS